ncbi:kelch domain-containing protein 7A [Brachionichthys hirsutus]|uniref:kelch domain-containing protein 7A n=1 Tax=Brachionichthys hirsutus TaxID=412623 RepID=UPI0036052391
MSISDLLGIPLEMELLWKLSLSVAVVLLVSFAYRIYSSREEKNIQASVKDDKESENANFQDHKKTLRLRHSPNYDTKDGSKRLSRSATDEGRTSDSTDQVAAGAHPKQENRMASSTGCHSHCFLQKLEGTVGVGRELRQDLEYQGAYSSFLSKAEIQVKDANVVLQGTGDQVAHGKVYDYYVESSSHSITESNVLRQLQNNTESQPVDFGSPSFLNHIITHDVVSQQSTNKDDPSLLAHSTGPALLRKKSALSAAKQSEPFIPSATRDSTLMTPLPDSNRNEPVSVCPVIFNSKDSKAVKVKEHSDLQTVAGASALDILAKTFNSTDVEALKSKIDLSNCLEALYLAKKHGQVAMQQAALEVMSENYLQVLRDPNLYSQLLEGQREQIQKWRVRGRSFVMVADVDPRDRARNTGETEQRETSSAVYYYDDYKDSWHSLCLIPQEVVSDACAMCTMDNYLFVAVGCQGTGKERTPSRRVFCYNPLASIWKEICPMNEARPQCKLAALEGYVYAIGGECLSVERYDPCKDRWTFVAPLPNDTFAVAHHVTVCKGELYVCGGTFRYTLLRYSPQTNIWRAGFVAGGKDKTADMVAVWRSLYRFDIDPLLGISVYRYHTVARLWYECCTKRSLRCPTFHCVAMDHMIYCVGHQFTMRFEADEVYPAFTEQNLNVLSAAKGKLFPFVLSLPDHKPEQPSVQVRSVI